MNAKLLATGSLVLGLTLIAGSFLLPRVVGARQTWTDQDARRYSEAAANLHQALHGHHRPHDDHLHGHGHQDRVREDQVREDRQRLDTARRQFQMEQERLETALQRGQTTAAFLKWTGIVLALAGIIAYWACHEPDGAVRSVHGHGVRRGGGD